ncbi:AsmA family protein [Candidatus Marithrix sp. Canyon 246]|uniref:AsmA family protein n=1 Tax=Candidatus Marithrix sp. Canyon 246 TaxID=1827136 RepID=UPI00084A09FF|nr:AsmA family protein [Candidatus Marithrix sp. Canyon 246]
MNKFLKRILQLLVVITALVLTVVLVIVLVVNPNDYKTQISQLVEKQTGRSLTIDGDISLTFFPWLGLKLATVKLGNAPGFDTTVEFASLNEAHVRVKLLPLFSKQLEVDTIFVDGMKVRLTRKQDGHTNWEDLVALQGDKSDDKTMQDFNINGLSVNNSHMVWDDQQAGSRYILSNLNLNTSAIIQNKPIQFQLKTTVDFWGKKTFKIKFDFNSQLSFNPKTQRYALNPLEMIATIAGKSLPDGKQTLAVSTFVDLDLKRESLIIDKLKFKLMDASLNGQLKVKQFLSNPSFLGNIKLANLNVPKLLQTLGMDIKLPLTKVSLNTNFNANMKNLDFRNLNLLVDENKLYTSRLQLDLERQKLISSPVKVTAFGVNLHTQLNINDLFSEPTMYATLHVPTFNPQKLLKKLEVSLPFPTKYASLKTEFELRKKQVMVFKNLNVQVDNNKLQSYFIKFDLGKENLRSEALSLNLLGVKLLVSKIKATKMFTDIQAQARLAVAPFNPRNLLKALNQEVPKTQDAKVLRRLSLNTKLQASGSQLNLENLKIKLDKTNLIGNLYLKNIKQATIAFNLYLDQIDIDSYLPPEAPSSSSPSSSDNPLLLPLEILRDLDINGGLKIGKMKTYGMTIQDLEFAVSAKGGNFKLIPKLTL